MSALNNFLKTTIVGGLMFLVPVILIALVVGKAMQFAGKFAAPVAARFPEHYIAGVAVATLLSAAILLLVSFLAGLAARTRAGRSVSRWFEESLLGSLPQYRMVKSMAEGLTQVESGEGFRPVLVSIEGGWQLGYLLEEVRDDWVTVFLPAAPTPMSGNVMYMPSARVRPLDIPMTEAMLLVKRMGVGSAESLRRTDLTAVPEG